MCQQCGETFHEQNLWGFDEIGFLIIASKCLWPL